MRNFRMAYLNQRLVWFGKFDCGNISAESEGIIMKKLVWDNNGKPEWQEQTEAEADAEFRRTHDGKSADELIAEKRK